MKKFFQLFSVVLIFLALSFSTSAINYYPKSQNNNDFEKINQEIINKNDNSLLLEEESELNTIEIDSEKSIIDNDSINVYYEIPRSSTKITNDITITATEVNDDENIKTNKEQPEPGIYNAESACQDFWSYEGFIKIEGLTPDVEYEIVLETTNDEIGRHGKCPPKGGDNLKSDPSKLTTLSSGFSIGTVEQKNLKEKPTSATTDYVITSSMNNGAVSSPDEIVWRDNEGNPLASQDLQKYEGEKTIEGTIKTSTILEPGTLYEDTYLSVKDEDNHQYDYEPFDIITPKGITSNWYYVHWYYLFLILLLIIISFILINFIIIKKQRSKIDNQ